MKNKVMMMNGDSSWGLETGPVLTLRTEGGAKPPKLSAKLWIEDRPLG